jgi:hypothetical protein
MDQFFASVVAWTRRLSGNRSASFARQKNAQKFACQVQQNFSILIHDMNASPLFTGETRMTTADPIPLEEENAQLPSSPQDAEIEQLIVLLEATSDEPSEANADAATDTPPANPRRDWAERIRGEQRLPGSLRQRLAAVVEEAADFNDGEEPRLTVSQIATVFAETIPSLLGVDRALAAAAHPGGDVFFQQGILSDDDAARLARQQLQRTGFYRQS